MLLPGAKASDWDMIQALGWNLNYSFTLQKQNFKTSLSSLVPKLQSSHPENTTAFRALSQGPNQHCIMVSMET